MNINIEMGRSFGSRIPKTTVTIPVPLSTTIPLLNPSTLHHLTDVLYHQFVRRVSLFVVHKTSQIGVSSFFHRGSILTELNGGVKPVFLDSMDFLTVYRSVLPAHVEEDFTPAPPKTDYTYLSSSSRTLYRSMLFQRIEQEEMPAANSSKETKVPHKACSLSRILGKPSRSSRVMPNTVDHSRRVRLRIMRI